MSREVCYHPVKLCSSSCSSKHLFTQLFEKYWNKSHLRQAPDSTSVKSDCASNQSQEMWSGSIPSHPVWPALTLPQPHSGWEQKFPLGPACCSSSVDWTVYCRSHQYLAILAYSRKTPESPLGKCVLQQDLASLSLLMLLTILPPTHITNLFLSLKQPFIFHLFLVQWATSWKGVFCAQQDYRGAVTQQWVGLRSVDMFLPNVFIMKAVPVFFHSLL